MNADVVRKLGENMKIRQAYLVASNSGGTHVFTTLDSPKLWNGGLRHCSKSQVLRLSDVAGVSLALQQPHGS